jgi:hypothetical protein
MCSYPASWSFFLTWNLTNRHVPMSRCLSEFFLTNYSYIPNAKQSPWETSSRSACPRTRISMLTQNDANGLYPALYESTSPSPLPSSTRSILILESHLLYVPKADSSIRYFDQKWYIQFLYFPTTAVGHAVSQLIEALCYKLEGRGFDSRWGHWNFQLT